MNAQEVTFPKPVRKVKKAKKHKGKHKRTRILKFDKEGFLISWGVGIASSVLGVIIIWSTKKESSEFTPSNFSGIERILPQSTKEILIFLLGNLLLLLGLVCIFIGIKIFARYLSDRLKR